MIPVYNLTEMLHMMNVAKDNGDGFIVKVLTPGLKEPEMIFNDAENIQAKLEYYSKAYTEELTLKANSNVVIVEYGIVDKVNANDIINIFNKSI